MCETLVGVMSYHKLPQGVNEKGISCLDHLQGLVYITNKELYKSCRERENSHK